MMMNTRSQHNNNNHNHNVHNPTTKSRTTLVSLVGGPPWGFRSSSQNNALVISQVLGGSRAEKEGLEVGDVVTNVNNKELDGQTAEQVQRILKRASGILRLTVQRGSGDNNSNNQQEQQLQQEGNTRNQQQQQQLIVRHQPAPSETQHLLLPQQAHQNSSLKPFHQPQTSFGAIDNGNMGSVRGSDSGISSPMPAVTSKVASGSGPNRWAPVNFSPITSNNNSGSFNLSNRSSPLPPLNIINSAPVTPAGPLSPCPSERSVQSSRYYYGEKLGIRSKPGRPISPNPPISITLSSVRRANSLRSTSRQNSLTSPNPSRTTSELSWRIRPSGRRRPARNNEASEDDEGSVTPTPTAQPTPPQTFATTANPTIQLPHEQEEVEEQGDIQHHPAGTNVRSEAPSPKPTPPQPPPKPSKQAVHTRKLATLRADLNEALLLSPPSDTVQRSLSGSAISEDTGRLVDDYLSGGHLSPNLQQQQRYQPPSPSSFLTAKGNQGSASSTSANNPRPDLFHSDRDRYRELSLPVSTSHLRDFDGSSLVSDSVISTAEATERSSIATTAEEEDDNEEEQLSVTVEDWGTSHNHNNFNTALQYNHQYNNNNPINYSSDSSNYHTSSNNPFKSSYNQQQQQQQQNNTIGMSKSARNRFDEDSSLSHNLSTIESVSVPTEEDQRQQQQPTSSSSISSSHLPPLLTTNATTTTPAEGYQNDAYHYQQQAAASYSSSGPQPAEYCPPQAEHWQNQQQNYSITTGNQSDHHESINGIDNHVPFVADITNNQSYRADDLTHHRLDADSSNNGHVSSDREEHDHFQPEQTFPTTEGFPSFSEPITEQPGGNKPLEINQSNNDDLLFYQSTTSNNQQQQTNNNNFMSDRRVDIEEEEQSNNLASPLALDQTNVVLLDVAEQKPTTTTTTNIAADFENTRSLLGNVESPKSFPRYPRAFLPAADDTTQETTEPHRPAVVSSPPNTINEAKATESLPPTTSSEAAAAGVYEDSPMSEDDKNDNGYHYNNDTNQSTSDIPYSPLLDSPSSQPGGIPLSPNSSYPPDANAVNRGGGVMLGSAKYHGPSMATTTTSRIQQQHNQQQTSSLSSNNRRQPHYQQPPNSLNINTSSVPSPGGQSYGMTSPSYQSGPPGPGSNQFLQQQRSVTSLTSSATGFNSSQLTSPKSTSTEGGGRYHPIHFMPPPVLSAPATPMQPSHQPPPSAPAPKAFQHAHIPPSQTFPPPHPSSANNILSPQQSGFISNQQQQSGFYQPPQPSSQFYNSQPPTPTAANAAPYQPPPPPVLPKQTPPSSSSAAGSSHQTIGPGPVPQPGPPPPPAAPQQQQQGGGRIPPPPPPPSAQTSKPHWLRAQQERPDLNGSGDVGNEESAAAFEGGERSVVEYPEKQSVASLRTAIETKLNGPPMKNSPQTPSGGGEQQPPSSYPSQNGNPPSATQEPLYSTAQPPSFSNGGSGQPPPPPVQIGYPGTPTNGHPKTPTSPSSPAAPPPPPPTFTKPTVPIVPQKHKQDGVSSQLQHQQQPAPPISLADHLKSPPPPARPPLPAEEFNHRYGGPGAAGPYPPGHDLRGGSVPANRHPSPPPNAHLIERKASIEGNTVRTDAYYAMPANNGPQGSQGFNQGPMNSPSAAKHPPGPKQESGPPHGDFQHHWYKMMYRKLHQVDDPDQSVMRYHMSDYRQQQPNNMPPHYGDPRYIHSAHQYFQQHPGMPMPPQQQQQQQHHQHQSFYQQPPQPIVHPYHHHPQHDESNAAYMSSYQHHSQQQQQQQYHQQDERPRPMDQRSEPDLDYDHRGWYPQPFMAAPRKTRDERGGEAQPRRSKSVGRYESARPSSPPSFLGGHQSQFGGLGPTDVVKSTPADQKAYARIQPKSIEHYVPGDSSLARFEAQRERSASAGGRVLHGVGGNMNTAGGGAGGPPGSIYHSSNTARYLHGLEAEREVRSRRDYSPLAPNESRTQYRTIQSGGEVPHAGLRQPAPQRSDSLLRTTLHLLINEIGRNAANKIVGDADDVECSSIINNRHDLASIATQTSFIQLRDEQSLAADSTTNHRQDDDQPPPPVPPQPSISPAAFKQHRTASRTRSRSPLNYSEYWEHTFVNSSSEGGVIPIRRPYFSPATDGDMFRQPPVAPSPAPNMYAVERSKVVDFHLPPHRTSPDRRSGGSSVTSCRTPAPFYGNQYPGGSRSRSPTTTVSSGPSTTSFRYASNPTASSSTMMMDVEASFRLLNRQDRSVMTTDSSRGRDLTSTGIQSFPATRMPADRAAIEREYMDACQELYAALMDIEFMQPASRQPEFVDRRQKSRSPPRSSSLKASSKNGPNHNNKTPSEAMSKNHVHHQTMTATLRTTLKMQRSSSFPDGISSSSSVDVHQNNNNGHLSSTTPTAQCDSLTDVVKDGRRSKGEQGRKNNAEMLQRNSSCGRSRRSRRREEEEDDKMKLTLKYKRPFFDSHGRLVQKTPGEDYWIRRLFYPYGSSSNRGAAAVGNDWRFGKGEVEKEEVERRPELRAGMGDHPSCRYPFSMMEKYRSGCGGRDGEGGGMSSMMEPIKPGLLSRMWPTPTYYDYSPSNSQQHHFASSSATPYDYYYHPSSSTTNDHSEKTTIQQQKQHQKRLNDNNGPPRTNSLPSIPVAATTAISARQNALLSVNNHHDPNINCHDSADVDDWTKSVKAVAHHSSPHIPTTYQQKTDADAADAMKTSSSWSDIFNCFIPTGTAGAGAHHESYYYHQTAPEKPPMFPMPLLKSSNRISSYSSLQRVKRSSTSGKSTKKTKFAGRNEDDSSEINHCWTTNGRYRRFSFDDKLPLTSLRKKQHHATKNCSGNPLPSDVVDEFPLITIPVLPRSFSFPLLTHSKTTRDCLSSKLISNDSSNIIRPPPSTKVDNIVFCGSRTNSTAFQNDPYVFYRSDAPENDPQPFTADHPAPATRRSLFDRVGTSSIWTSPAKANNRASQQKRSRSTPNNCSSSHQRNRDRSDYANISLTRPNPQNTLLNNRLHGYHSYLMDWRKDPVFASDRKDPLNPAGSFSNSTNIKSVLKPSSSNRLLLNHNAKDSPFQHGGYQQTSSTSHIEYSRTLAENKPGSDYGSASFEQFEKDRIIDEERRKRQEKEWNDLQSRRHGYLPTRSPGLPSERYDQIGADQGILRANRTTMASPAPPASTLHARSKSPSGVELRGVGKCLYNFSAHNARELSFSKGDLIRIRKMIDPNWYEGELRGRIGICPVNYVELAAVAEPSQGLTFTSVQESEEGQAKALFTFQGRNVNELSLSKGDIITLTRKVDDNWYEGRESNGRIGIFPSNYIQILSEPREAVKESAKATDYPNPISLGSFLTGSGRKTPKIGDESGSLSNNSRLLINGLESIGSGIGGGSNDMNNTVVSATTTATINNPPIGGGSAFDSLKQVSSSTTTTMTANNPRGPGPSTPKPADHTLDVKAAEFRHAADTLGSVGGKMPANAEPFNVLYNYTPANADEMELREGDRVFVVEKCDDGWFIGTSLRTGLFGTFPGNYVTPSPNNNKQL